MSQFSLPRRFMLLGLLVLVLAGCNAGYQQIDGQWKYVTIDSGYGRRENEIPGVDQATLKPFKGTSFAADKNQVYYEGRPLAGADAATFRQLRSPYWADSKRVYWYKEPIPGADPKSFDYVRGFWTRDANNFYYGADPVNPKDPNTFRVVNANWARDSQWYYPANGNRHIPIKELDYASFQILKAGWAKDCCRVFYFDRVVEGADPASFEVINDVRGRDKAFYYLTGFKQRTVAEEEELKRRTGGK